MSIEIPATNVKGLAKCFYCKKNDQEFTSEKCLECFNNPLLKDNFEPNAEYLGEEDEES